MTWRDSSRVQLLYATKLIRFEAASISEYGVDGALVLRQLVAVTAICRKQAGSSIPASVNAA